ncbi:MAG: thioesterase family protein [Candidatus Acidiferrales bacterium]
MAKKKQLRRGLRFVVARPVEFRRTIAYYDRRLPAVLSTPSMIGQMEVAAAKLLQPFLPAGAISVGTHIDVSHRAPATVGERLRVRAAFDHIYHPKNSGRLRYVFAVEARAGSRLIGEGTVERAVVEPTSHGARRSRGKTQRRRAARG